MSERPVIVVGARQADEAAGAPGVDAGARAVCALYLAAIDCIVVDLSTGDRLSIPAGVLEGFAAASPEALRGIAVGEGGHALVLSAPALRVPVAGLLAGLLGSPEWMAGHAARTRGLRAGQVRRLTETMMRRRASAEPA